MTETSYTRDLSLAASPSEFSLLSLSNAPPARSSARYLQVSELDDEKMAFNATGNTAREVLTKRITISGLRIVLEDAETCPVFKRLHERTNIRSLALCADEIIVRSPLHLPGTNVTISARVLTFAGTGRISTKPLVFDMPSDRPEGYDGQAGGSIQLYVRDLEAPGDIVRLITEGAKGQDAQPGEKGDDGSVVTPWDGIVKNTPTLWLGNEDLNWAAEVAVVVSTRGCTPIYASCQPWSDMRQEWLAPANWMALGDIIKTGSEDWPTDGAEPKRLPGKPGLGGDGGHVFSRFADLLGPRSQQTAGAPGQKAPDLAEAKAGTPVKSCKLSVAYQKYGIPHLQAGTGGNGMLNLKWNEKFAVIETHEATAYDAVVAPDPRPDKPEDRAGRQHGLPRIGAGFWMHPLALSAVVSYVRDAFRAGQPDAARPLVDTYLDTLAAVEAELGTAEPTGDDAQDEVSNLPLDLVLLQAELVDLVQRIDGPNDYFGHPAGWVPALSFQSNLAAFQLETKDAIARLYLSYWMEHNQAEKADRIGSAQTALAALQKEIEQAAEGYREALEELTKLEQAEAALRQRINTFVLELGNIEADLRRGAQNDLRLEKMLRASGKILGGIAQIIPVGQPALAAVGQGLSALADWDSDEPFDSIKNIGAAVWDSKLVGDVLLPKAKKAATDYLEIAAKEQKQEDAFSKEVAKIELNNKAKKHIKQKSEAKGQVLKALGSMSVSKDELDAAVAKAIADCPEYQDKAKELAELGAEKAAYAGQILAVATALDAASNTIVTNRLTQIELRDSVAQTSAQISPEGLRYTQAMGERALERLQRYQYYFADSYLYLWLNQVPNFDANADFMFDELKTVLKPTQKAILSGDDFDRLGVVFEENLKSIADHVLTYYNTVLPQQSGGSADLSKFTLELSENQLAALNSKAKAVAINPMELGKVHLSLEDVRIFDVQVMHAELVDPPNEAVDIRVRIHHPDESTLRRDGQLYKFRNTRRHWGAMVSHARGKTTITPEKPDPVDQSLIRHLLGGVDAASPLFTRPSAWSELTIERRLMDMQSDYSAHLAALTLEVHYTAREVDDNHVSLFVAVPGWIAPRIACSHTDIGGRQDGEGSFLRTFRRRSNVTLTAPPAFGQHIFAGWQTRGREGTHDPSKPMAILTPESAPYMGDPGNLITENTLTLSLDDHTLVRAVYVQPAAGREPADPGDWPQGPEGWILHDWMLVNEASDSIEIVKIDYLPWRGGATGYGVERGKPMGNDQVKLALGGVTLAPGEAMPFSVFTNPDAQASSEPQIQFVLTGGYAPFFNGAGDLVALYRWTGSWTVCDSELGADLESRTIRFKGG